MNNFSLPIDKSININYPDNDYSNHCQEIHMIIGNRIVSSIQAKLKVLELYLLSLNL